MNSLGSKYKLLRIKRRVYHTYDPAVNITSIELLFLGFYVRTLKDYYTPARTFKACRELHHLRPKFRPSVTEREHHQRVDLICFN